MLTAHWLVLLILITGMVASVAGQKLTVAGAITGGIIGFVIYWGSGFTGLIMMAAFFVLGTAATAWHKTEKVKLGLVLEKESQRTAAQVAANAGVAGILALLAIFNIYNTLLYQLMMAAVFAAATADTVSSELGTVYGRRFFNILTFKKDEKGLDGVVSWEGTLAGLAGSIFIALIFMVGHGWQAKTFFIILIAGTIGNFSDSVLGAAFERKGVLKNNTVNFLNTAIAALAALLLFYVFEF